jgi:fermentation-respiration switch protein FrsA (DUF1100 family)
MFFIYAIVLVYFTIIVGMYIGQRKLIYHPDASLGTPLSHNIPEVEAINLSSSDGLNITSWFKNTSSDKLVLIFFHGNSGHIGNLVAKIRPYVDAGFGILLVGYRGYGGNQGKPSEKGLYEDAATALEFLLLSGVTSNRWVLYGESLGSAIAVEMAARFNFTAPVASVVLEAPFTSMADAAKAHYPFIPIKLLLKDKYNSLSKIEKITSPLMVLHGDIDKIVPQKLGIKLFDAANDPKYSLWINGAGHNDLYDFDADKPIIEFIKENGMSPSLK